MPERLVEIVWWLATLWMVKLSINQSDLDSSPMYIIQASVGMRD